MAIIFPFAIVHKTKGYGTALSLCKKGEDTYVVIDFGAYREDFAYPDRFVFDLKAKDPALQKELEEEYEKPYRGAPYLVFPGLPLGTRARDVYDKCCKDFGWDFSKRDNFGQQKLLFAEKATPEGYSVWMIVHNSQCELYNKNVSWYNYMKGDTIEEVWNGPCVGLFRDTSRRVTFVRTKSEDNKFVYKFWGIYDAIGEQTREVEGEKRVIKTYKRIAVRYP